MAGGLIVGIQGAHAVLHVAVTAHVQSADAVEVRFVLLVEGIGDFEFVGGADAPVGAHTSRKVAVSLRGIVGAGKLTEEKAGAP